MKGFIIGFITCMMIVLAICFAAYLSKGNDAEEIIEGSEAQELFEEFTEDVYDYIEDIVNA